MKRLRRHFTCPAEFALYVLSGKWNVAVVAHLTPGPLRFSELRRAIPDQSDKVLSATLHELESLGLLEKVSRRGALGGAVTYGLTAKGHELRPMLKLACNWALAHAQEYEVSFRWTRLAGPKPAAEESLRPGTV